MSKKKDNVFMDISKMKLTDFKKIVVFDTETTGTTSEDQIIEIGISVFKLDNTKFVEDFKLDYFVKLEKGYALEDIKIDRKNADGVQMSIADLTGITTDILDNQGITEFVVEKVKDIIFDKEALILGYNLGFDLRMLLRAIRYYYPLFKFESFNCLDVMTYYKDFYSYCDETDENGMKLGHRLDAAVKNLNVEVPNTHRACDDADATWEVFKALFKLKKNFEHYINAFGYNQKYGAEKIENIEYYPQGFRGSQDVLWQVNHKKVGVV